MVTVTDNAGCTGVGSTAVQVVTPPTISAVSNTPVCVGGNITLNATPAGGSGVYTGFQWSGPNNFTASVEDPVNFPATMAASGIYTVTVTDNTGCTATTTFPAVAVGRRLPVTPPCSAVVATSGITSS